MSKQYPSPGTFTTPAVAHPPHAPLARQSEAVLLTSPHITTEELLLPRSIAGVFDLAFDIYRDHFRALFTLSAVTLLPLQTVLYLLFNVWLKPLNAYTDTHPDDIGAAFGLITGGALTGYPQTGVPGLLSLAGLAVISVPIALALADIYRGQTPHWADCWRRAFRHIPRVLGGWFSLFCVLVAVVTLTLTTASIMAGITVGVLRNAVPPALSFLIGAALLVIPYVAGMTTLAAGFLFTTPLIALEDTPITSIPARNWQLVKRRRARSVFSAIVFLPIVFFTVQLLILLSLSGLLALVSLPSALVFVLEAGFSALLIAFLQPYLLIFINVLYFDYRIQRDGLDVTLLADNLEASRVREDNR